MKRETMVTLILGGYLGKKFGRYHKFSVYRASEAIKAMCTNYPEFEEALLSAKSKGFEFAVFMGNRNITNAEHLTMGAHETLRIIPIMEGSKRAGLFQTIIGAIIFVASFFVPGMYGWGQQVGVALMVGGVVQLLTPQAKGLKSKEDTDNQASYAFGGPTNTTAQGNPIPLLYGEREIGGAVISAEILSEDQM